MVRLALLRVPTHQARRQAIRSALFRSRPKWSAYSQWVGGEGQSKDPVSEALRDNAAAARQLRSAVRIPSDPQGLLQPEHPASSVLGHSSIIVHRQIEMMNVMMGFEEANKYVILDPTGQHIGYMAERELGMANTLSRQFLRTHRQFTTHIFDRSGNEVLRLHRPYSLISSTIRVYDPVDHQAKTPPSGSQEPANQTPGSGTAVIDEQALSMRPSLMPPEQMPFIGEVRQQWAPLRRKYNMFVARSSEDQRTNADASISVEDFAYIDSPFLAWDFSLKAAGSGVVVGSVDRNFSGLARELFTDAGIYALRMDSAAVQQEEEARAQRIGRDVQSVQLLPQEGAAMTLDQRAIMLAMAVTIDYDYFSRDRGGGFFFMPFPMGGGGGAAAGEVAGAGAGAAAGGAAAEAGGVVEGAGAAAGGLARGAAGAAGAATTEGAAAGAAGAGTIAGYEAMRGRGQDQADQADVSNAGERSPADMSGEQQQQDGGRPEDTGIGNYDQPPPEEVWGSDSDPFGGPKPGGGAGGGADGGADGGAGGDGDGDGGIIDSISDSLSGFLDS